MQILVDDTMLEVDVRGDGDAIVMLHGFPLTHAIWDAQVDALSRSHRVVNVDLRGMGASRVTGGPYLMEMLAADVAGVMDALSIDRASIAGHSMGGYVALAFARMYTERVARFALVCSKLAADTPEQAQSRYELADRCERENTITPALDAFLPRMLSTESAKNSELVRRVKAIAERNSPQGLAAILRGAAVRPPSDDIAPDIEAPVLIVAGGADGFVPPEDAKKIAACFANARLVVAERSAHLPMVEEPQLVSAALADLCADGTG